MSEWDKFLQWELASRDSIDFKKIYVDMAGDLVAGLLLSQIVYWFLPSREGKSKLRVFKDGYYWIAKARTAWWDEVRLKPQRVDRALNILKKRGIVSTSLHRFNGAPTKHIRIIEEGFLKAWAEALPDLIERIKSNLPKPENPFVQSDKMDLTKSIKSITEITTETPENTTSAQSSFSITPQGVKVEH